MPERGGREGSWRCASILEVHKRQAPSKAAEILPDWHLAALQDAGANYSKAMRGFRARSGSVRLGPGGTGEKRP
jgi:hypothetical protein